MPWAAAGCVAALHRVAEVAFPRLTELSAFFFHRTTAPDSYPGIRTMQLWLQNASEGFHVCNWEALIHPRGSYHSSLFRTHLCVFLFFFLFSLLTMPIVHLFPFYSLSPPCFLCSFSFPTSPHFLLFSVTFFNLRSIIHFLPPSPIFFISLSFSFFLSPSLLPLFPSPKWYLTPPSYLKITLLTKLTSAFPSPAAHATWYAHLSLFGGKRFWSELQTSTF